MIPLEIKKMITENEIIITSTITPIISTISSIPSECDNKAQNKQIMYNKLFPVFDDKTVLSRVAIDNDSVHYITTPINARKILQILKEHLAKKNKNIKECTIIDGTSGVGGDTISFANVCNEVIAIEIDPDRCELLKKNIDAYKLSNVKTINGNCLDVIPKITHGDIIYLDPPWGGESYKENLSLTLTIDNKSIEQITMDLFDPLQTCCTPIFIVLKLPKNYNIKYFYTILNNNDNQEPNTSLYNIYLHELTKMNIIVIEKNYSSNCKS